MIVTVHPVLDQMVQWCDGKLCQKHNRFLAAPINERHFATLVGLHELGLEFVREIDQEAGKESWELPTDFPWSLPDAARREIHCTFDWDGAFAEAHRKALRRILTTKAAKKCAETLAKYFVPIENGIFDIIGWDHLGRMSFCVTSKGALETDGEEGQVFVSVVGLKETDRLGNW